MLWPNFLTLCFIIGAASQTSHQRICNEHQKRLKCVCGSSAEEDLSRTEEDLGVKPCVAFFNESVAVLRIKFHRFPILRKGLEQPYASDTEQKLLRTKIPMWLKQYCAQNGFIQNGCSFKYKSISEDNTLFIDQKCGLNGTGDSGGPCQITVALFVDNRNQPEPSSASISANSEQTKTYQEDSLGLRQEDLVLAGVLDESLRLQAHLLANSLNTDLSTIEYEHIIIDPTSILLVEHQLHGDRSSSSSDTLDTGGKLSENDRPERHHRAFIETTTLIIIILILSYILLISLVSCCICTRERRRRKGAKNGHAGKKPEMSSKSSKQQESEALTRNEEKELPDGEDDDVSLYDNNSL